MKIKIIFVFVFLIVLTVNSQITTKKVTTTPQLKFKQQQKVTLNKNSVNFTATKTTLKQNATNTQKLKGSTTTAVKGQSTTIKKTNPKPTTAKVSNKKFEEWKKTYGKVYKTQKEETAAEQNFSRCANKVQKLNNQPGGSFKCSLNADSDMNYRQKVKYRMGLRVPNEHSRRKREVNSYDIDDFQQIRVKRQDPLPDTLDLREFLTPIKNQGICGSCWAFSVATVLEYEAYLISGKIMSLSEQEMLDCNT
jgi:C1A family cysteine protease